MFFVYKYETIYMSVFANITNCFEWILLKLRTKNNNVNEWKKEEERMNERRRKKKKILLFKNYY